MFVYNNVITLQKILKERIIKWVVGTVMVRLWLVRRGRRVPSVMGILRMVIRHRAPLVVRVGLRH